MSGGCIHTPVHKYDCWNHGDGACIEKREDICSGCLSMARASGTQAKAAAVKEREAMAHEQRLVNKLNDLSAAVKVILEGFDKGLFVRDISRDASGNWAMIYVPYIKALAVAGQIVER